MAVLAAACDSGDGRQLAPPNPNETATLVNSTTSTVPPSSAALGSGIPGEGVGQEGLTLRAPWEDEGNIEPRFTCANGAPGSGVSPALSWSGVPAGTNNIALVVTDLSADGFVHWVVVGIDPEITGTAEGLAPAGAIQGKNGFGAIGWGGPCPPAGSGEHEYLVQLYALNKDLGLTDGFDAQPAIDAIEAASDGDGEPRRPLRGGRHTHHRVRRGGDRGDRADDRRPHRHERAVADLIRRWPGSRRRSGWRRAARASGSASVPMPVASRRSLAPFCPNLPLPTAERRGLRLAQVTDQRRQSGVRRGDGEDVLDA